MGGPLDRLTLQAPLSPQPLPGFTNPVTVRKSPGGGFRLGTTAAVNWPGPLANPNPATSDDRRVCLDANPEPADSEFGRSLQLSFTATKSGLISERDPILGCVS